MLENDGMENEIYEYADTYTVFISNVSMVCYDDEEYSMIKIINLSKAKAFQIVRTMSTYGVWCTVVREEYRYGTDCEESNADGT